MCNNLFLLLFFQVSFWQAHRKAQDFPVPLLVRLLRRDLHCISRQSAATLQCGAATAAAARRRRFAGRSGLQGAAHRFPAHHMTSLFCAETPSFRGWMLSLISVMIHTILAPTPRAVGYERSEAALWRKAPKRTPRPPRLLRLSRRLPGLVALLCYWHAVDYY